MRETNAALFGEEVIAKTDKVYGIDEEGEIRGSYRPSGYPGVSATDGLSSSPMLTGAGRTVVVCHRRLLCLPHYVQGPGQHVFVSFLSETITDTPVHAGHPTEGHSARNPQA